MSLALIIQNNYETTQVGLGRNGTIIAQLEETNQRSSKYLVPLIEQILNDRQLTFNDLDCIIVNQGPGPFTSLRVVIATINGLSFARKLPLVGVDGLVALLDEHRSPLEPVTLALLNAYNQDAYYSIAAEDIERPEPDWNNIDAVLTLVAERYPMQNIYCIGSGVELFKDNIINALGTYAIIPEQLPLFCSLDHLYKLGLAQWQHTGGATQIMPLYVKTQQFIKRLP